MLEKYLKNDVFSFFVVLPAPVARCKMCSQSWVHSFPFLTSSAQGRLSQD